MTKYPPMELTQSQSVVLDAIFDTFLAQLTPEEESNLLQHFKGKEALFETSPEKIASLSKLSASSVNVSGLVVQFFTDFVSPTQRAGLTRAFDILATHPGSLLLTGYWQPFHMLKRQDREKVLLGWKTSKLAPLRALYASLSALCFYNGYSKTGSPLGDAIGYVTGKGDVFFETHKDYQPVDHERIPMLASAEEALKYRYDVIVVGSGAGGGVVAAESAKAGLSVLVVEKGKYLHQREIVQEEEAAFIHMYDGGRSTTSENGSIQCLSGGSMGGGTAVNYLVSLKPQHFVREEWVNQHGLEYFMTPQFDKDLNVVMERIGASTENVLNTKTIQKFYEGCQKLGYHIEPVPLNTGGRPHHCNRCIMGCKSGIKNSTTNTWLLDALHHGAKFLDRTYVNRVITKGGKATGVECYVHDSKEKTIIQANKVVIACGALRTPSVLKSSGLKNPHIGSHLRLQPILFNFGVYDEPIRQNEGPLISSVCNASDNWNGDNYGAKIEEGCMMPGGLSSKIPWKGAQKHKELMLKNKNILSYLNVVRDKDSVGRVVYDPSSDNPVYEYALSKHDEASLTVCIEKNMKILAASGARELHTSQVQVEPFVFRQDEESRVDNPRFIEWLKTVRSAGVLRIGTPLISVHQLGSCRMGVTPKSAAVKPTGETWEVKNLFVADGSLFPTAVGVNPMVTIEAIALSVSRHVISSTSNSSKL